ncbi:MAG: Ig-like domain-containing protein [Gemmatimonadaceae bacterium]|nr:Ig-like domain-containing protein [Gemmatimonadaceae bacterium]
MRRPVPRPRVLLVAALVLAGVTACLELPVALPIEDQAALKCAPDDVLEDNDTPGAALQVQPGTLRGLSCRRVADSIEDRDFYRLVGAPDSLYRAWLDAPDADSVELRLFDDSTGAPVVREIDGNLRMPPSGRLLASVRLCCGAPGDSLPYDLLLSDVPNHAPLPAFDWAPATPLVGVTVTFTSLASDADGDSIAARDWRLGDGRTATGLSPTFTFGTPGNHTVTHRVTDVWGRADSLTRTITIGASITSISISPPAAAFYAIGDSMQFTAVGRDSMASAVPGLPITWSIADTSIVSLDSTGLVIARAVGVAYVRASVFGVIDSAEVTVTQLPASVEAAPGAASIAHQDSTVQLTATVRDQNGYPIPGAPYRWVSDDTTIVTVSPTGLVSPVTNGTTTVRAIVDRPFDTVEDTVLVLVAMPLPSGPIAAVIASPDTAMMFAPYRDTLVLHARAVDALGNPVTNVTFQWTQLGNGTDFQFVPLVPSGDSIGFAPPYYGTSGRRKIRLEVRSGAFADTLVYSQVAPRTWLDLTAGADHTCGISYSDYGGGGTEVYCWGSNSKGQLGLPLSVASVSVPTRVPFDSLGFQSLDAGDGFTCAAGASSGYCWGDNEFGQLGGASSETCGAAPCSSQAVSIGIPISRISAGRAHACSANFQFSNGSPLPQVHCWGRNGAGQLGQYPGMVASSPTPLRNTLLSPFGYISDISAFGDNTCAVYSGARVCWGRNDFGEFGFGSGGSNYMPQYSAQSPAPANAFHAGGDDFVCGAPYFSVATAGRLSCWGSDASGQLGLPASVVRDVCNLGVVYACLKTSDVAPLPQPLAGGSPLTPFGKAQVGAGAEHVCVISANELYCWGRNTEGQLGDGTTTSRSTPVNVTFATGYHDRVTSGRAHGCLAINEAGLYCWGQNTDGRLGDGTTIDRRVPVRIVDP